MKPKMCVSISKTILLVEDDFVVSRTEKKMLETMGYIVVVANTGEEAIDIFKKTNDIDLILMDIDLGSGIDGTEAAAIILKDCDVPVVFLSSHTESEIVEKTEKITSYGYVVKGTGITVLDASIKMAFKLFDANRKIVESEIKQKSMISNISDVIAVIDKNGINKYKSPNIQKLFGWYPDEIIGISTWENIYPEHLEHTQQFFSKLLQEPNATGTGECLYKCKDGSYKWIEFTATNLTNDSIINGILMNYHDISERKLSEEALKESEKRYRGLIGNLDAGVVVHAPDTSIIMNNARASELLGLSKDQMIGKQAIDPHWKFISETNTPLQLKEYPVRQIIDGKKQIKNFILGVNRASTNDVVWLVVNGFPVFGNNGEISEILISFIDITKHKLSEEALFKSEGLFRSLAESSTDYIMRYDNQMRHIYANKACLQICGKTWEEFIGKTHSEMGFPPHLCELWENNIQKVFKTGNPQQAIFEWESIEGKTSLDWRVMPEFSKDGTVESVIGVSRDITVQKHAEEALRKSETLFKSVVQNSLGLTMLTDETGKVTYLSSQCENVLGYPADKFIGQIMPDIIHPDDVAMCQKAFEQVFIHGQKVTEFEYRIIDADDNVRWISHNASTLKFNESFSGIQSSIRDITGRKMMEEKLRESENNYRTLSDSGQALIWTSGTDKLCNYFNRVWLEFTGRTFEQEYGNGWTEGVHPDDFQHCLDIYTGSFDRREKFSMEYRVLRHDGEYRWLLDEGSPRYNSKGEFIGYIGHCFDITERKIAEEKIKSLLIEKELLLKEVHHRIKNNMNTVVSIMWLQAETLKEPTAIAALKDARSRVQSMMVLYDKLYRTNDFKELSFKEYIVPIVDDIIDNFPNKGKVKMEKYIDDIMIDSKILSTLGIIINEILTNIMKYAFTDRNNGLIKVTATLLDKRMMVTIADNGIGIPESINIATSSGFGFQLVDMMMHSLRGTIKIERNNGTKFILEFNL